MLTCLVVIELSISTRHIYPYTESVVNIKSLIVFASLIMLLLKYNEVKINATTKWVLCVLLLKRKLHSHKTLTHNNGSRGEETLSLLQEQYRVDISLLPLYLFHWTSTKAWWVKPTRVKSWYLQHLGYTVINAGCYSRAHLPQTRQHIATEYSIKNNLNFWADRRILILFFMKSTGEEINNVCQFATSEVKTMI